jgi:hypothetical protein
VTASTSIGRVAVAISTICVLTVVVTLGVLMMPAVRLALGFSPAAPVGYALGDRLDVPSWVFDSSDHTVVVFARSSCAASQRLSSWLAEMTARVQRQTSIRVVMVVGRSRLDEEHAFAATIGLGPDRVVVVERVPKIRVVPTVIVVNRHGRVLLTQEGAPTSEAASVMDRILAVTGLHK